jgi:4-hydroxythreonine-4-phosphate dehydrogenase
MSSLPPRIAITAGEPAGVGPDLLVRLAQRRFDAELVAVADPEVLQQRARLLGVPLALRICDVAAPTGAALPGTLSVLPVSVATTVAPGTLDPRNARHVLNLIDRACDGCRAATFAAMVTAPVHKGVINDAGFAFSGHTEYLAQRCGVPLPVMMLAAPGIRVALATTHLPLAAVATAITRELVEQILTILNADLRRWFELARPRIAVCGLNPHAGEGGHLGREEIDIIEPAIRAVRNRGVTVTGPWSADTAFTPARRAETDAYLAMYHDQGLPVLKALGFGEAVNVTLGLPIIRTSVDHGTALELAGTGAVEDASFIAAIDTAIAMARRAPARA